MEPNAEAAETPTVGETHYLPREVAERAVCRLQMVYNYMRNGRIPYKRDEETHHRYMIPMEAGDAWIEGYLKRKADRRRATR